MLNPLAAPSPFETGLTPERLVQAGGPDMTRYVVVCCLLLAAIGVLAYFFRRFLASGLKRRAAMRSLEVLDLLPLGGKKKLVVVRCYDRNFFLAIGEKEIHSLAEIDADTENLPAATTATQEIEPQAPLTSAFPAALSAVLARMRTQKKVGEPKPVATTQAVETERTAAVQPMPSARASAELQATRLSEPDSNAEITARRRAATGRSREAGSSAPDRSSWTNGEGILG